MDCNALRKIPLFSGLEDADLLAICQHGNTRSVPSQTIVIHEGDQPDSLYIILNGKVRIYLGDEHGKEITVNTMETGDYFGELALIDDAPRTASVITLEQSSFLVISRANFRQCLADYPETAINLVNDLAHRMRVLTANVKSLALVDVYGRVARTLIDLAAEENGKMVIHEKLTHQDIANLIGASREMVSRILKDLRAGGYITIDKKRIVINHKLPPAW